MIDMQNIGNKLTELGYIYEQNSKNLNYPIYAYKTINKDIKTCIIVICDVRTMNIKVMDYWVEAYKRYKNIEDVTELGEVVTNLLNDVDILEKMLEED